MSLAARCNHCQTVFRITGAQLAAAQGWVRCGGCAQVFDAASNLVTPSGQPLEVPTVDTRDGSPATAAVPAPAPVQAPAVPSAPAAPFQAMPDIDLELPDLGALKAEANPAPAGLALEAKTSPHADSSSVSADEGLESVLRAASTAPLEPAAPSAETPSPEPVSTLASSDQREPFWVDGSSTAADLRGDMALSASAAKADEPSTTGTTAAPKPKGGLNGLGILLLTLTLAMLAAYAARGHMAQAWPEARPLVLQACAVLGCQLPAIRQLDAVKVQGSSLSRDDASGHHRLRIQLLNADEAPVLMPAFDLTLVDAQGEVLARRMLDPMELQPAITQLAPGAEAALSITLDLKALDSAAISSFRLSAYYP